MESVEPTVNGAYRLIGPIAAWSHDFATGQTAWSEGSEELVGLPPGSFAGSLDALRKYVHAQDQETIERKLHEVSSRVGMHEAKFRLVWPDGSVHWVLGRARVEGDAQGKPTRMTGVALELSDGRMQEELRQSEARYRDLFENANDIIYTLDLEGKLTSVNRRATEAFGYTLEESLGRSVAEMIPPEYHPRMHEALRRKIMGAPTPTVYELEIICKNGHRLPVEISSRLIVHDGQPVGIQGIARDLSERKRAEAALRAVRVQLELITDTMSAAVTRCSRDLRYIWVSKRYAQWLGRPAEAIAGQPIRDIIGAEGFQTILPYMQKVLAGERVEYETAINFHGPGRRWIHVVYTPLLDARGVPEGWVGVVTDITDHKRSELALQEANRRKDDFLAMLAHELRNPLAPIRNAVEVLKLVGSPDPTMQQVRSMIERQVSHLARLVDDLLDVSRISRGKILLRKEWLDLTNLVQTTAEDHRRMLQATQVQLQVQLPEQPLWVSGDRTRLAQVLGNLLHNASKFTDAGGKVLVELSEQAHGAVLTVRDTGIGMEADMLARLFEPFSQADRSLDRSRGGLGLGLALVKGLTELHGGSVRASSAGVGQGSEFVITLPLGQPGLLAENRDRSVPPAGASLRILIVEDNQDAAFSLRLLLELQGNEVAVAYTGLTALQLAQEFHPEVVLCDIGLPGGMDGYAVATTLRADPELFGVALIALSGYGQEEDQRKARQAGFDRHFTKPVDPGTLTEVLNEIKTRRHR